MHTFRILLTIAGITCMLSRAEGAGKVATFSSLPKGDELEMTFTTKGCFYAATYKLKFRRSAQVTAQSLG